MSTIHEIIQTMKATPATGWLARRFFHFTAPRHVDNIHERLNPGEKFYCFILLASSKKNMAEALICTDSRIIVWNNHLSHDDEISLDVIESTQFTRGLLSGELHLFQTGTDRKKFWRYKCQNEILSIFNASVNQALQQYRTT